MFGLGKKKVDFHPVFAGDVVTFDDVPDAVFQDRMLGEGYAVVPQEVDTLDVLAPVDGTVSKVFRTLHAFAMKTEDGLDVLVHIGLGTVELGGKGFTELASKGQVVKAGDPVIRVDAAAVRAAGLNLVTPVVFTKKKQVQSVDVTEGRANPSDVCCKVKLA
ncbi:MAG: glucose PTS transporter subunit IIA [Actinomycetaceae bacterium]|nr:glucose PTS transporter subunit IIA [Actinomycetaceae bacterium]